MHAILLRLGGSLTNYWFAKRKTKLTIALLPLLLYAVPIISFYHSLHLLELLGKILLEICLVITLVTIV